MQYNEIAVISFLTHIFHSGNGYSSINTARSALSTFMFNDSGITIGNSSIVKRFLKGVFERRPPQTRYVYIWDVKIVLVFLKNFYPNEDIPLNYLTYKLIMLMALATKQRAQTLHAITINEINMSENLAIIPITKLLKHNNQRNRRLVLHLEKFSDPSICVIETLKEYLLRTKDLRKNQSQLFISFQKPYNPVSIDTISRWIKTVMMESGIDTDLFKAHSTRAASTSNAKHEDIPIDDILKSAGWSRSKTFEKFYDKIIMST